MIGASFFREVLSVLSVKGSEIQPDAHMLVSVALSTSQSHDCLPRVLHFGAN